MKFEVHRLHAAMRVGRNERPTPQLIVRLTQEKALKGTIGGTFRGGSTLVVDLTAAEVKYCIVKGVSSQSRQMRTLAFHAGIGADPLQRLLLSADAGEPFGLLHAFGEHV